MLATDLALALDAAEVMLAAGLDPDSWQRDLLTTEPERSLLLCSRQSGKSTVVAAIAAHTALYRAPALVLLLSPSLRQSQELFRKVSSLYRALGNVVPLLAESALRMEFENGSRIVCLPGKEQTIRGYSGVDLLVVDEAARVPDELYATVRPMLAVSGGRLACLSTPFGKRGFFYREWSGSAAWHRVEVPAASCTRIPPDFLEEERAALGDWWYRQEYCCEFVEPEDQVFGYETILAAISDDIAPLSFDFEGS